MTKVTTLLSNESFDWESFESKIPKRTHNPKVKRHPGDKSLVFCRESYSQDLYELYTGKLTHLKEPKIGSIILGVVSTINSDHALVDVNWREDAIIELRKENPDFLKYIQPGFPIEVIIERVGSVNGSSANSMIASYSKNILSKKRDEIMDSIGKPVAFLGTVKELIHGGYFVDIDGIQCFMPGSLGGMNKLINFEDLLGKQIYVVPVNYSREKDYIVVSHRDYLKALVPEEISKLKSGVEYSGFVTGCSRHGIFVEFNGCLTGLISRAEILKDDLDRFDNQKIRPGEAINFFIKEIVDNDKIVLTQKPVTVEPSAWDDIETRYKVPSIVTGKVKKIVRYGAFIEIEPKVVGLLHKSHLNDEIDIQVGQEIEVKITKIDKESKKVDFVL